MILIVFYLNVSVSVPPAEAQWQNTISERGEVVCPTCSVVTRKTVPGLKKHMEICQKVRTHSGHLDNTRLGLDTSFYKLL